MIGIVAVIIVGVYNKNIKEIKNPIIGAKCIDDRGSG